MAARFINVDLEIRARFDIGPLVRSLEQRGLVALGSPKARGGVWSVVLESDLGRPTLARATDKLLCAVETLESGDREIWARCLRRDFNFGFECGDLDPWSTATIGTDLVVRLAAVGAAVKFTTYSEKRVDREPEPEEDDSPVSEG